MTAIDAPLCRHFVAKFVTTGFIDRDRDERGSSAQETAKTLRRRK
jgi:hypothetical protein